MMRPILALGLAFHVLATAIGVAGEWSGSGSAISGERNFSLSELLSLALQENREIAVERTSVKIQGARIDGAMGMFDPELSVRTIAESRERAQNIREVAATDGISTFEQQNVFFQTGLTGRIPLGTRYEMTLNSDRLKNSLNARPESRFRPEYDSDLAFTLTQPLLRDAGRHINKVQLFLARGEREVAHLELQQKILEVASEIVQAYADLVYAQGNLKVRQDAVEVATVLKSENEKRVELGVMKPIDILQADAAISQAEDELIRAEVFLSQRQNVIKALVFEDFERVIGLRPFANDPLDTHIVRGDDLGYWITEALENNPEYRTELKRLGQEELRVDYAKNQTKPRVDLQGSIGLNGLSDSYGNSFEDFGERNHPEWTTGIVVRMPIGNREAKARLSEAKLRQQQVRDSIQFSRNTMISALDSALKRVKAGGRRFAAVGKSVQLAADTLTEERSRLEEGLTTTYDVLEMEKELADARARRLAARADIMKAIADVHRVAGQFPQLSDHMELVYSDDSGNVLPK